MKILFEDNDIIVCLKLDGIISQADKSGKKSMITLLEEHTGGTVYPVHRLDRETGGVMVYAKTERAAAVLSKEIAEHHFKKEYLAVICGVPKNEKDILTDLLFHDRNKNKSYVVERERKGVKKAELQYEVINSFEFENKKYSLIKVLLKTGRTHQIRVQFSHRKLPLTGDKKYGAKDNAESLGLWAYKIEFNHPSLKERLVFEVMPQEYNSIFSKIGEIKL